MKNLFKIATVLTVATLLVTGAFAQGKKPMAKTAPKKSMHKMASMTCPICHMPVAMKKSKSAPVAMKLKGKTVYCCSMCKMPSSMLAKSSGKSHLKMSSKSKAKKPMAKKPS